MRRRDDFAHGGPAGRARRRRHPRRALRRDRPARTERDSPARAGFVGRVQGGRQRGDTQPGQAAGCAHCVRRPAGSDCPPDRGSSYGRCRRPRPPVRRSWRGDLDARVRSTPAARTGVIAMTVRPVVRGIGRAPCTCSCCSLLIGVPAVISPDVPPRAASTRRCSHYAVEAIAAPRRDARDAGSPSGGVLALQPVEPGGVDHVPPGTPSPPSRRWPRRTP